MEDEIQSLEAPFVRRRAESDVFVESAASTSVQAGSFDAFRFLRSLGEFSQVTSNELKTLTESCRLTTVDSGQYIVMEGNDELAYGFIVISGIIAMLKTSASGKILIVELLQSGDTFGLLHKLVRQNLPEDLSARALQKSKVLWVPIKDFRLLVKTNPALFEEFVAHLLKCLRSSYKLSRGLAHDMVGVRIAAVLSSLSIKFANSTSAGKPQTVYFTRQQLADLTGTTTETAIRVTKAMQRDGIIAIPRPGVIRILDVEALHDLAEE